MFNEKASFELNPLQEIDSYRHAIDRESKAEISTSMSIFKKIAHYKSRHKSVEIVVHHKETYWVQLLETLFFTAFIDDSTVGNQPHGDHVLILEEWFVATDDYDDMLKRWPYPKEAHKFPKGWFEYCRLCIAVESDDRPYILYINRDAYTDGLMMAKVER